MAISTNIKNGINFLLGRLNIKIDSCTADKLEQSRLNALALCSHFENPIFPILPQFRECSATAVLAEVKQFESQMQQFTCKSSGGHFSFQNDYYRSPDAEILYAITRKYKPKRIIEVGSGNSTLLFRQAINDGNLNTSLTSIDPFPRREISAHSDKVIREKVEEINDLSIFNELSENDVLFIDSSHEVKTGNDVIYLFLRILPLLSKGVLIHIHDIFLPYDYPKTWIVEQRWNWTEQYLAQALLQGSTDFEVIWAGYYLQRSLPEFGKHFKFWDGSDARSLWLRKM